jgi:hypothetical protein
MDKPKPKNLHRSQIKSFVGSDYFLTIIIAIGVIAVIVHALGG